MDKGYVVTLIIDNGARNIIRNMILKADSCEQAKIKASDIFYTNHVRYGETIVDISVIELFYNHDYIYFDRPGYDFRYF